jgi:hypothetical protein
VPDRPVRRDGCREALAKSVARGAVNPTKGESVTASTRRAGRGYEIETDRFLVVEDQGIAEAREDARARPFSSSVTHHTQIQSLGDLSSPRQVRTEQEEDRRGARMSANDDDPGSTVALNSIPLPRPLNNKTIDLDRFIDLSDLDLRFVDSPYYVIPTTRRAKRHFAVTVDVANASWTNTIGAPELIAVWTDPDFDPAQRAFYYGRVLKIPTPRWTAFDAKYFGVEMPEGTTMKMQERAYTSPIWYTPAG